MNYKILIGSIIAVVILVLVSTTSAVNVNISGETGLVIEGPTHGRVGYPLTYGFLLTGQEGCDIWYYVDWDDGTNPVWLGPYEAGEIALVAKTWYECGIYNFLVQVEGCDGTMYSGTFEVTIHQPLSVEFVNPREGYFHFFGVPLFQTPLNIFADTVSLGRFAFKPVQINATDGHFPSEILVVSFYINNKIRGVGRWNPDTGYHEWVWLVRIFGVYNLKVQVQNPDGLFSDYISLDVWSFGWLIFN